MRYAIDSGLLRVEAEETGAQLCSVRSAAGTEYLWQGDGAYWTGRAPNLFPYVGRLTGGRYTYRGKSYALPTHGFASRAHFSLAGHGGQSMTFLLEWDEETLAVYPFRFVFRVGYAVEGMTLRVTLTVENKDRETMYFGLGGHPGINVPLAPGERFEEYVLRFPPCTPRRVEFSPQRFPTGGETPFPLAGGELGLEHGLFDDDAVVLRGVPGRVSLLSRKGPRGVELLFPDQPILGVWHMPHTDAPYVCLEPWSSLPSRQGVTEDLETQPGLLSLAPLCRYETTWSLRCF